MSNLGKQMVKKFDSKDEKTIKIGGQPAQGERHGFKKIVHSKPMDISQVTTSTAQIPQELGVSKVAD